MVVDGFGGLNWLVLDGAERNTEVRMLEKSGWVEALRRQWMCVSHRKGARERGGN